MKFKTRIYDTFQGRVIDFVPIIDGEVSIYYCGPTVYNYGHIGNFRPPVFFDLVHRFFLENGLKVKIVSNYTDIDDKIINEAAKLGIKENELTEFFIKSYEDTKDKLNILPLYETPKVSDYINDIVDFIDDAISKKVAYIAGDDVFFSVSSVKNYGELSKMKTEDLIVGSRISVDSNKRSPLDFVLWKKTKDEGIKFDADFGCGRPGWHTECLVMIKKIFKSSLIDIHGGGFDLKFPHHENERAQSVAVNDSALANYWMHLGFINMGEDKMSKSLQNVILMKDFLEKYKADVYRLMIYKCYYRAPLAYTDETVESAVTEIKKYETIKKSANLYVAVNQIEVSSTLLEEYYNDFMSALADDFNIANALAIFDRLVKNLNLAIRRQDDQNIGPLLFTFNRLHDILGFSLMTPSVTEEIVSLFLEYQKARTDKDFAKSDYLRQKLMELDII